MAEVNVSEVLKGTPPEHLHVLVQSEPEVDEPGNPIPRSTVFRYELKADGLRYVLLLNRAPAQDATYYVPAGEGSGIVDLDSKRVGDGPEELEKLRKALQGIGKTPLVR